jgi:hypothetical protein
MSWEVGSRQLPLFPSDSPVAVWPAEGSNRCPTLPAKDRHPCDLAAFGVSLRGAPVISGERLPLAYPQGADLTF